MIQIENISKVFRTSEVETVALNHVNSGCKRGRVCYLSWGLRAVVSLLY